MSVHCKIVIPARLASTRLEEKLLRTVAGKSILQHTYLAACRSQIAQEVVVAVDHPRLAEEVDRFGGRWVMTSPDCPSGTDRIAAVAGETPDSELLVNVQGDEPEIDPTTIDSVAQLLLDHPAADIATAATPIRDLAVLEDPSCVKVVLGSAQRAIYFSRAEVPHCRDSVTAEILSREPPLFWHHIGLYAYRRDFLAWFVRQPAGRLELIERLEQLRAIEAGKTIVVARVGSAAPGIDTIDDLSAFRHRLEAH